MGLLNDAIAEFREAIQLDPKDANDHANLGSTMMEKGLLDEAIAECREAIRLDPSEPFAHFIVGKALEEKTLPDEAITEYRQSIRLKPDSADVHACLGDILHGEGLANEASSEYQSAIALYRTAIKRNSSDVDSLGSLARMLVTCGSVDLRNPRESVQLARKASQLAPLKGDVWSTLGIAYYRTANYHGALQTLTQACEFENVDKPLNFFFLAMTEWQLGNRDAARDWHAKAVKWLEDRPQITGGEKVHLRSETEKLLGISAPASQDVNPAADKHANDEQLTTVQ